MAKEIHEKAFQCQREAQNKTPDRYHFTQATLPRVLKSDYTKRF